MKKLFSLLLVALFAVVLVACGDKEDPKPKDTTAPVITGADAVTISLGDEFNPLEGVTAKDDVDGDITLTAANVEGTVDVNKAGTYTLTYRVKDAAGNEAVKQRIVSVEGLANLINGDFSEGMVGWSAWADSATGVEAEVAVVNKEAVIDVKALGSGQWWSVQLKQTTINLKAYESYKLVFTARADKERYMNVQIQGGGIPGGKAFGELNFKKLTTEDQTFEFEFFVKGDSTGSELQFSFGDYVNVESVPAEFNAVLTKVYLSNVQIVAGPELENQAPELTAANITVKPGVPMVLLQGVTVADDRTEMKLSDVKIEEITEGEGPAFNNQNPVLGVYKFRLTATDHEGLETVKERTVTVAPAFDIKNGTFAAIAENGLPVDWIAALTGEVVKGVGEDGKDIIETEPVLNIEVADGVAKIDILAVARNDWRASFGTNGLALFKGTYTLSFEAKADADRYIRIAIEGSKLENAYAHVLIEASETFKTYTITYTVVEETYNRGLRFWFGDLRTGRSFLEEIEFTAEHNVLTTVYIKNVQVTEVV